MTGALGKEGGRTVAAIPTIPTTPMTPMTPTTPAEVVRP